MYQIKKILFNRRDDKKLVLQYMLIKDLTKQMIHFEEIAETLEYLSLHGNKLKFLPNMSMFVQLTELDISKNPIKIDEHLLDSLYSIPKLRSLHIDATQQEVIRIAQSIPSLQFMNGKDVVRYQKIIIDDTKNFQRITQLKEEIGYFKKIYTQLPKMFSKQDQQLTNIFLSEKQYNIFTDQIFQQYKDFDRDVNHESVKEGVKIYSKNKLMNIIDDEILDLLQQNGVGHSAVNLIQKLNETKTKNFEAMLKIILQMGYADFVKDQSSNVQTIRIRKEKLYLQQISRLKKQCITLKNQLEEVNKLNNKYVEQVHEMVNRSKMSRSASRSITPINKNNVTPMKKNQSNINILTPSASNANLKKKLTTQKSERKLSPKPSSKFLHNAIHEKDKQLLRLQQTLPLIKEIMNKKAQFNKQSVSKKQAFQTMQQFLFLFFFRKYGLKDIALKWSLSLIKSVQAYSRTNTLVYCFGSILKHRMEEEYYQKQQEFQTKVKEIIKSQQRRKVISKEFSQDQARKILQKLSISAVAEAFKYIEEMEFPCQSSALQQAFSKINIDIHQKQLKTILELFQKEDIDADGVITRQCATNVIEKYYNQQNIVSFKIPQKQLLTKIDPFKTNKILFSVLVSAIQGTS